MEIEYKKVRSLQIESQGSLLYKNDELVNEIREVYFISTFAREDFEILNRQTF